MNSTLDSGVLPSWSPYGAVAGSALIAAALLLAAGALSVGLLLVFTVFAAAVVTYTWSRRVEGARRAKDRLLTLLIVAAFGLALIPLLSLIFEVAKRGIPGLSLEFITEDARGHIGGRIGRCLVSAIRLHGSGHRPFALGRRGDFHLANAHQAPPTVGRDHGRGEHERVRAEFFPDRAQRVSDGGAAKTL